jgi:hypothetical protein
MKLDVIIVVENDIFGLSFILLIIYYSSGKIVNK